MNKRDEDYDPPRQLGRVPVADWELMKRAAAKAEKTFTKWALDILMPKARKETKK